MRKGIAVAPGVAVGKAYCLEQVFVNPSRGALESSEVAAEIGRFFEACRKAANELRALQSKVRVQLGEDTAAVFGVHESILADPGFCKPVEGWIRDERMPAQAALARLMEHYDELFSRNDDALLRERVADVRDVGVRVSRHLSEILSGEAPTMEGPLIVVADELLPSQVLALGDVPVSGIITSGGSQTSHAAIVARSRGIPAVSGVEGILRHTRSGDLVVVDGREGVVLVDPEPETVAAYRKLEREFVDLRFRLAANRDQPAETTDGHPVRLLANINSPLEARTAGQMGATGIGLYRTEYLYLMHPDVPDEDEQTGIYGDVIAAAPGREVVIRTLDIGGDKTIPYLGRNFHEANPFMGWRSIRLSFEHPEFFATQIRAVLRAAAEARESADIELMFPMVTSLEEVVYLRAAVDRAAEQLARRGIAVPSVPVGIMVEVPAAALAIDHLLDHVDFVSIGSNDLVQYLMAADRDNPKVSHLCQPLAPPVLRVLKRVIDACHRAGKPVTLCGEMAGQPEAFVLLLGMGLDQVSMSPALIPSIKELARSISLERARHVLRRAWRLRTATEVRTLTREFIATEVPGLDPMVMKG